MKIVGCDLHARQQTIAMVDTETRELTEETLSHGGSVVRDFYAGLESPVVVGIEATGALQWFLGSNTASSVEWGTRRRSERKKRGNRSMIGGTHACCGISG